MKPVNLFKIDSSTSLGLTNAAVKAYGIGVELLAKEV
jgi:hypothetical protein